MAIEHPRPTDATIKELYGNAFGCAFPGCAAPLYVVKTDGSRRLSSRVAHIHARSEGGPRWDPTQSAEANRAVGNLILLCIDHHAEVDDLAQASKYPASDLRTWKAQQLADFDQHARGWTLTAAEVKEVAETIGASMVVENSTLFLGGKGGKAPGAGGGGGGAVGPGAEVAKAMTTSMAVKNSTLFLGGEGGEAPGAGGGGGGAVGPGAKPGRGGQGGRVHAHGVGPGEGGDGGGVPDVGDVGFGGGGAGGYTQGIVKYEANQPYSIRVGRGGLPGFGPVHAEDGGVTTFGDDLVRADGGKGGKPGYRGLEPRDVTRQDVENGVRVTSIYLVEIAQQKFGLINALGAGFERYDVPEFPFDLNIALVFAILLTALGPRTNVLISIHIVDEHQETLGTRRVTAATGDDRPVVLPSFVVPFVLSAKNAGLYHVVVKSGDLTLGSLPFELRLKTEP